MNTRLFDGNRLEDRQGQLERALIDEHIRAGGFDPRKVNDLPAEQRDRLLKEASIYAASKLAEVESRAHYVHEIHGER